MPQIGNITPLMARNGATQEVEQTLKIFKVAFPTFWFNLYDDKPSGTAAKRGTSYVT